jgi:phosphorylcholine metabolism protein LicD
LIDREVCKNNLLDFKKVLDRAGVEFGLIYGTLLGAVREGNFIEHDEDVDVYIKESELDKLLALLFDLRQCGFEVARYYQRRGLLSFIRDNDYIDVYVFWRMESGRWRRTSDASLPASSLDSHDLINFLGVQFRTLKDHKSFLDLVYGTDWATPKKNFHARF